MSTLFPQPQPRDGTWLVDKDLRDAHEAGGAQTRGRRRRKNNRSRLVITLDDDAAAVQAEWAGAGGNSEDFFPNDDNNIEKIAMSSRQAQKVDIPRTLFIENPHLTAAATSTFAPAPTAPDITQHLPADTSNYTSQKPRKIDDVSQGLVAPKGFLPPHLARKAAASTEKTTSSAEKTASSAKASATGQNGSARNAEPLADRAKTNPAPRGRGNGRGHGRGHGQGGGGRGGGGRSGGNAFAMARAEIPKADPNRWKTNWAAPGISVSSSDYTGRPSSGWGTKHKKRAGANANPPPADWSGKLAPPPPDWDSRPGFRVDQSYDKIMDWMGEIEHHLCAFSDQSVPLNDVTATDGTTFVFCLATIQPDEPLKDLTTQQMGEMVPHYWIPMVIGPSAPQVFWNELLQSTTPRPDDPIDLEGAKPWWERFVKGPKGSLNFLKEPPFPTVVGIDPDQEDAEQKLKRKHDKGSAHSAENRRRYELERIREKLDKQRLVAERHRKAAAMATAATTPINSNRIKPGFKLFVRSARAEDMGAVKDIYNYYIENTTSAPEMERRSKEKMVKHYRDIRDRKMPFLVAYKPGGIVKAPRQKKNQTNQPTRDDVQLPDTIVGFAFADDYGSSRGMYQFTAKLEFYTKETDYMNGVGSCLVDRMVLLLDATYQERGGHEIKGDDIDGVDHVRILKNLIIELPFEKPERLEWMGKWLEESFKFREVGLLEKIGTKNGKA